MATQENVCEDADITVNLFGAVEIITEQCKLTESKIKSTICSKLFVILMLNRRKHMTSRELSELLWPDKDCDDPTGRVQIHPKNRKNIFFIAEVLLAFS